MAKIYITGIGQVSHLGKNIDEALAALKDPSSENSYLRLERDHLENEEAPDLSLEIDNLEVLSRDSKKLSRANQLLIHVTKEALAYAGLSEGEAKDYRVGVIVGTTSACTISNHDFSMEFHREEAENIDPVKDFFYANPAQSISHFFDLNGPVAAINNACTSGTDALGLAKDWIEADMCDIVIAGGVDLILENMYLGFRSLKLFDGEYCKPFSKNREGLILCEAAAMLVVESESVSAKRKSSPISVIKGYGLGSDCYHPTTPHPEAYGLDLAINSALKESGIQKNQIDLINAHATGTPNNDLVEGQYLHKNFTGVPVFGTKAYTGHTLGAAGALEVIWGCLCFLNNFIPKTLGFEEIDPDINLIPTTQVMPYQGKFFLSTSLGFGGANSVIILERFIKEDTSL
jgi:3-oxoacyl-[acyl-carrier-protein] synthase II